MGKPSKLTEAQWAEVFERDGLGVRRSVLAAEFGITVGTIAWQADRRGLKKSDRPGCVDHRRRPVGWWPEDHVFIQSRSGMTPGRWRELLARRNGGEADADLALEYGVSESAIGAAAGRMSLRKMDVAEARYRPRGPAAGVHGYTGIRDLLKIDIDWDDPVGTVRAIDRKVGERLKIGDGSEAGVLWAWRARVASMLGVRGRDVYPVRVALAPPVAREGDCPPPQGEDLAPPLVLREAQRAPEGPWGTWLFLGGRGAGKTLAGAAWVADRAEAMGAGGRLALIGATLHDAREVMIGGVSGVMGLARWREAGVWPVYEPSRRRLRFPGGAEAFVFSAEEPERLRGPQFGAAWADEFCAWPRPEETLALLRMGLRLPSAASSRANARLAEARCLSADGDGAQAASDRVASGSPPQLVVTTTPRPIGALKRLRAEAGCVETHAGTKENVAHLAAGFLEGLEALYGGTRRAAQEMEGLVVELDGALFTAEMLAGARAEGPGGGFDRVVVGLDPTASVGGDACGIVVVGRRRRQDGVREAWVLADRSRAGLSPEGWARRAVEAARDWGAQAIVAEVNQGGDMVSAVLKTAQEGMGVAVPVRTVRAAQGKRARAEPVAALYEQGRVRHAGVFAALEEELMAVGGEDEGRMSLDRADALVWAVSALMLNGGEGPRIRSLETGYSPGGLSAGF